MDWFEQLTGFREGNYEETRAKLTVEVGRLHSLVSGKSYGVGDFELVPLQTLREWARSVGGPSGRLKASVAKGRGATNTRGARIPGRAIPSGAQFNA